MLKVAGDKGEIHCKCRLFRSASDAVGLQYATYSLNVGKAARWIYRLIFETRKQNCQKQFYSIKLAKNSAY